MKKWAFGSWLFRLIAIPILLTGAAMLLNTPAHAVDFSGKRITIVVPFNEGGGTDSYTRFLQPYFQKYLPGNPKILRSAIPE